MMLSFRPALDVHGWLLDLDTRCRFWSAVLEPATSSSPAVSAAPAAALRPRHDGGDVLVEEDDESGHAGGETVPDQSSPSSLVFSVSSAEDGAAAAAAPLPRVIAAAAAALEASRRGDNGGGEGVEGVRRRLEKTLQQVAVHRVQQIYAHLNGVAALEAAEESPTTTAASGDEAEQGGEAEEGAEAVEGNEARLEEEARGLVEFACKSCGGGGGRADGSVGWGDEDLGRGDGNGGGASWGMMMPYLPVWVGFAAKEQVSWCTLRSCYKWRGEDGRRSCFFASCLARFSRSCMHIFIRQSLPSSSCSLRHLLLAAPRIRSPPSFSLKVALFMEALLSRCASDVLAGRGEEESSPLKLLSDASFYEMEAVAQSGKLLARPPQ